MLGSGTIGHGIAQAASIIKGNSETHFVAKGKLSQEKGDAIIGRIRTFTELEAAQIVLEGTATADEVDTAMKLGAGHPIGPCELADFGGFDVFQMACDQVFEYTHRECDRFNILYRKMLEAGRLGKKNGKGFMTTSPTGPRSRSRYSIGGNRP